MMAHTFNPSTLEAEAGGSLWVQGQPGLHSEFQEESGLYRKNPVSKNKTQTQANQPTHALK